MKRLVPLFAALLLTSSPAPAATEDEDAAAILRAVIRDEAKGLRSWSKGPIACAVPVIEQSTFAWLQRPRARPAQSGSNGESTSPVELALPFAFFPNRRMSGREASEAREVANAVQAIVAGQGKRPVVTRLRSEWLSPPFRLCDQERYGLLQLSSPVISGEFAFVSVEWDCVLCGHGLDYALKRHGKKWIAVKTNIRWVS